MVVKKSKKSGRWVVGTGHDGLEASIPASTRRIVDEEEKKTPRSRGGTASAAASSAGAASEDHAESMISGVIATLKSAGSPAEINVVELAEERGVSTSFARFWLRQKATDQLAARGVEVSIDGDTLTVTGSAEGLSKAKRKAPRKAKPVEAAKPKVDADFFAFDKTLRIKIETAVKQCWNIWLAGPTGCGKSEYFTRILEELKLVARVVSFHGEASADDLLGHYTIRDGDTVWIEGAMVDAMKRGVPLICEEIDAAPPEANLAMQRALETRHGRERSFENARNGEVVTAKEGFCILATANSAGGGDHTGLYTGVQVQNAAFRNRFVYEKVDYADAKTEVNILVTRTGMPEHIARKMRDFAEAARQAVANGELFTPISTRSLLAFGFMLNGFLEVMKETDAIREALLSSCIYPASNPSDEEALRGLMQRIFGVR